MQQASASPKVQLPGMQLGHYTSYPPRHLHHASSQVSGSGNVTELPSAKSGLPLLPSNARYVYHANECYDWGTAGWLLQSNLVQVSKYR